MNFPAGTILDTSGVPITHAEASFSPEYEGASTAARMGTFGMSSAGPNASAFRNLTTLRRRSRELERNNPTAKGAIDSFVSSLVGTDISPNWNIANKNQKDELQLLWDDSQSEADFYGVSDFYGTAEIVARSMVRDGEGFGRFHDVDPGMGLVVPLQIQLLEADHFDAGYNDISPEGNQIRYSIEWKNGRRYKYWPYADHPGENFITGTDLNRVGIDASDVTHVFRPLRAGQARGISWLAPIIVKLHDIDIYDDAEVVRKKAAALWGGFVYTDTPAGSRNVGGTAGGRIAGVQSIRLEPGTFPVLHNNQKIDFSQTADVGNNYLSYMKVQFRLIARGFGITYEQLTGDLSDVNFSSIRAGLIEMRRLCEAIVARTLVFQYCRPYVNRWIRAAVLNGATETISVSEYLKSPRVFHRVAWNMDGWDSPNPVQDEVADYMAMRNGKRTRGEVVAKAGGNIDKVDRQNEAEMKSAQKRGLFYDSYPSQVDKTGKVQQIVDNTILESTKNQ